MLTERSANGFDYRLKLIAGLGSALQRSDRLMSPFSIRPSALPIASFHAHPNALPWPGVSRSKQPAVTAHQCSSVSEEGARGRISDRYVVPARPSANTWPASRLPPDEGDVKAPDLWKCRVIPATRDPGSTDIRIVGHEAEPSLSREICFLVLARHRVFRGF